MNSKDAHVLEVLQILDLLIAGQVERVPTLLFRQLILVIHIAREGWQVSSLSSGQVSI